MKKNALIISLLLLTIVSSQLFSQTTTCNGTLPFEEKDGLLTIEMESGIIKDNRWKIGTETINNEEIKYLHWTGAESFNALSGAPIEYKIKINTPGTYRFAWRMRVGKGTSKGEHNDAWLKIDAEDFYGIKNGAKVYPKPYCNSSTDLTCAAGTSVNNYIKAFGNRLDYGFVTNTNDHVAHRVFVTFNEAKVYTITVDARSSYLFIDKMVLRRNDISDSAAFNLSNSESSCYDASLSTEDQKKNNQIKIYPNPTKGKVDIKNLPLNSSLVIYNIYGAIIRTIITKDIKNTIDISDLEPGVYFISNNDNKNNFVKKIIKI
ncbi:hypothetical protein BTO14_05105 [Polaribacter butkevichii]|uniref:Secretion system C-terminal sorting domain-containing protein n=2 Tax=Polaribacter butkevichii TaxID=218490 RepID=A0A2P6CCQ4_9FLAO|nr:hypothetical protein BTO14_05105 [Polaribacter butkevichii]